jgi:hypothetical protein
MVNTPKNELVDNGMVLNALLFKTNDGSR